MTFELLIRSILLGAGLAMDAFSVSLADGLNERRLNAGRALTIAGTFAMFQFAMPVIGWGLVRTAEERFAIFRRFVPWIALILLLYIGGKMLSEGIQENREDKEDASCHCTDGGGGRLSAGDLFVQGVATSIDALSVGFTIAEYTVATAVLSSMIIGVVTLFICIAGLFLGRQIGTRLSGSASILGGAILIVIGIEIWVKGVFF